MRKAKNADRYEPVALNPRAWAQSQRERDAEFRAAYDALEDEFAALAALVKARHEAGLSQIEIARRMGTTQSAIARLEGGIGARRGAPTLATLRRYAEACGKKLVIEVR